MNKTFLASLSLATLLTATSATADQRDEQQALAQSKISAAQAVAIAEKASGAHADNLELDMKNGRAVFDLDLRNGQKEYDIHVDAVSGDIIKNSQETDNDPQHNPGINMAQAIAAAEKAVAGKVVDAELENTQQGLIYQTELLGSNGERHYVDIDAADGKVLRGAKP